MRKLYDSGALIVILFLLGFVLTLLRRRADNKERPTYQVPEPTPEEEYSFYLPVRNRIISKERWKEELPEVLAALWAVDEIRSEELPPLAADLLEAGYDGKYLRRLAGEMVAGTRADVADLADKAFAELGVLEPMSVTAANRLLTRYFAEKVLNRELDPAKAVRKIAYLHDWDHQAPGKEFVMLNYAYRERPVSSNHGNQLEEQTRAACVSFLQANRPQNNTSLKPTN
jgi:hypothetical protein